MAVHFLTGATLASAAHDDAPERLAAQCMKRRIKDRPHGQPPPVFAALGFNFTGGEARPRRGWWYEKEDQFLFEHFFSAGGKQPYKRAGTFVELGANDGGDTDSTTLWFERALGWSGVLIEGTPDTFKLLQRNRGGNERNRLVNAVVSSSRPRSGGMRARPERTTRRSARRAAQAPATRSGWRRRGAPPSHATARAGALRAAPHVRGSLGIRPTC